jgi:catechol 2,3-dioxygenase-like lactoylglutathione lyase family enzyme
MAHFSFTKVVVDDLEAAAAFYTATFGLEEQFRVDGEIAGLEMAEIVYAPTAAGAGPPPGWCRASGPTTSTRCSPGPSPPGAPWPRLRATGPSTGTASGSCGTRRDG